jgi:hypothetical protein
LSLISGVLPIASIMPLRGRTGGPSHAVMSDPAT